MGVSIRHTAWSFAFATKNLREQMTARRKRNNAFLYWLKQNVYCRMCGATEDLTFHHEYERRNGGKTLSQMAVKTPGKFMDELMKGFFLCGKCHGDWHVKEFGEPPNASPPDEPFPRPALTGRRGRR